MPDTFPTLAFLGGGNMARSLVGALLRDGRPAASIVVVEPHADTREALHADFGVAVHAETDAAIANAATLVLAVKPQVMPEVCRAVADVLSDARPLVISIAAGLRLEQIDGWLGGGFPVVRCMPNTPALIGEGATGLIANAAVAAAHRAEAEAILGSAGITAWIDDEALMDTVTALSGSGPAYVFLFIESLEEAAAAQGLARETARTLAIQTVLGAARMARESGEPPSRLRERVTSPNGTTQAALEQFAADGFRDVVARALDAAARRGRELAGGAR